MSVTSIRRDDYRPPALDKTPTRIRITRACRVQLQEGVACARVEAGTEVTIMRYAAEVIVGTGRAEFV